MPGELPFEPDPAPASFCGWQRLPGQRWVRVTEGQTYDEARDKIFDVRFPGPRRDVVVLRTGQDPNARFKL